MSSTNGQITNWTQTMKCGNVRTLLSVLSLFCWCTSTVFRHALEDKKAPTVQNCYNFKRSLQLPKPQTVPPLCREGNRSILSNSLTQWFLFCWQLLWASALDCGSRAQWVWAVSCIFDASHLPIPVVCLLAVHKGLWADSTMLGPLGPGGMDFNLYFNSRILRYLTKHISIS